MADGDIAIKDLSEALQIDDSAEFVYTQDNGGTNTTFKAPVNQIARKIAESITYTNLETTAKTLVDAINELVRLGSPILLGTTAPISSQGANGNLYVQYTEGTGSNPDTVDSIYAKIDGAWCEIQTGGGGGAGGHTIVDDAGTSLTQRANLQFIGAYSEDNSVDDTTEVNVVRNMTRAQFNQLSADEKTGLINITDESLDATQIPIQSGSDTNTKDYIDTGLSGKADTTQALTLDYTEVDVALDSSGEGTLFTQEVMVLMCKDLTSDSKYVGYVVYFTSNGQTKVKSFNRSSATYTSNAVSETRKIGVRYLKYIS